MIQLGQEGTKGPTLHALVERIENDMSPSLRRVANFALAQRYSLATMSLDAVAQACDVSKASVVRFCRALGYDGFRSFRRALIREQLSLSDCPGDARGTDLQTASPGAILASLAHAIDATSHMLDPDAFVASVDQVARAKSVVWYGLGDSGFLAMSGSHRLVINGINSKAVYMSEELKALTRQYGGDEVIICISRSGRLAAVLDAIRTVRQNCSARIIAITGDPGAPLAQLADWVLTSAPVDLYADGQRTTLQSTQMSVVDALVTAVLHSRFPDVRAMGRVQEVVRTGESSGEGVVVGEGSSRHE